MERPHLGHFNAINDAAIMHKILGYTGLNEALNNAVGLMLLQLMETEGWLRGLCDLLEGDLQQRGAHRAILLREVSASQAHRLP